MSTEPIIRRDPVDTGRTYLCIDLKSFYASVECIDRGFDPFDTNLVVADPDRCDTTICLAVSPALKKLGVPGRCRVFQIPKNIKYIKAKPRMKRYMEVSAQIYGIYLQMFSPQDIHVYSIDECFIDVTPYLSLYKSTAKEIAVKAIDRVHDATGICATAGIGTNLFLCKVALDIQAKHVEDHIGFLDEVAFRKSIWHHRPLTDIWGFGPGITRRLQKYDVYDLEGITHIDERFLFNEFGSNAEFIIDHAWGYETCTIKDIQAYRPKGHSISNGQVLARDYTAREASTVLREMVTASALDLVEQGLVTNCISLYIGYSWNEALVPSAGASRKLPAYTNSRNDLQAYFLDVFAEICDPSRPIRRVNIGMGSLMPEELVEHSLFEDTERVAAEHHLSEATLAVQQRFGKDALIRGVSLRKEATQRERNKQVGGHNAE